MNTATTPSTTTPPAFAGWWRPSRRTAWTRLVEGATYGETMTRLLDALANVKGGDTVILRVAVDPNRPVRPYHAGGRRLL